VFEKGSLFDPRFNPYLTSSYPYKNFFECSMKPFFPYILAKQKHSKSSKVFLCIEAGSSGIKKWMNNHQGL